MSYNVFILCKWKIIQRIIYDFILHNIKPKFLMTLSFLISLITSQNKM